MDLVLAVSLGLGALVVALTAHEVGHLAAGRFCGFRFGLLAVGPICVVRSGERLRLRWLPPSHWGPMAMAYPVNSDVRPARAASYAAGGTLASAVVAAGGVAWMAGTSAGVSHSFAGFLALAWRLRQGAPLAPRRCRRRSRDLVRLLRGRCASSSDVRRRYTRSVCDALSAMHG